MTSHRISKPLLVDESLPRAFAVKYLIYSLFGISGAVSHIPSISLVAGEGVATALGVIIAIFGAIASVCAWNSMRSQKWERREFYSTIILMSFILMYVIALIGLALAGVGNRVNLAILATAFLVMPLWRIRFIVKSQNK